MRVDEDEPLDADREARLLPRLTHRGGVRCLPALDSAPRQHPARPEIRRADDEDAALVIGRQDVGALDPRVSPAEQRRELDGGADDQARDIPETDPALTAQ